jgi:hypothetical protein
MIHPPARALLAVAILASAATALTAAPAAPAAPKAVLAYADDERQVEVKDEAGMVKAGFGIGDEILSGWSIRTLKTSAELGIAPGGSMLKLSPGTTLYVDSLDRALAKGGRRTVVSVAAGKIRAVVAKGDGRSWQVQGMDIVAGVRGTDFIFESSEGEKGRSESIVTIIGLVDALRLSDGARASIAQGRGLLGGSAAFAAYDLAADAITSARAAMAFVALNADAVVHATPSSESFAFEDAKSAPRPAAEADGSSAESAGQGRAAAAPAPRKAEPKKDKPGKGKPAAAASEADGGSEPSGDEASGPGFEIAALGACVLPLGRTAAILAPGFAAGGEVSAAVAAGSPLSVGLSAEYQSNEGGIDAVESFSGIYGCALARVRVPVIPGLVRAFGTARFGLGYAELVHAAALGIEPTRGMHALAGAGGGLGLELGAFSLEVGAEYRLVMEVGGVYGAASIGAAAAFAIR